MPQTEAERLSELKGKLRRLLGNPTTNQLSDDQAKDAIDSAVGEYSKYRPIQALAYVTTLVDVATYSLALKERIISVKEVFYTTYSEYVSEDFFMLPSGNLEGLSLFENPSLWIQYMQRLESWKRIFDGDFSYDRSTKMLTLIPAPSTAGLKVYYIWSQAHNVLTVPDSDVDTLMLWAKAEAKDMMGSKKAFEIQSVSGYGESVTFGAKSETMTDEAEKLRERFAKRLGRGIPVLIG